MDIHIGSCVTHTGDKVEHPPVDAALLKVSLVLG